MTSSSTRRRLELMKGRTMTNSHSRTLLDPRSSADSAARAERELNSAIVSADISASYEEFIAIVDQFYAEDVEVRSDSSSEPLIGRARVESASANPSRAASRDGRNWRAVGFGQCKADPRRFTRRPAFAMVGRTRGRNRASRPSQLVRRTAMETVSSR